MDEKYSAIFKQKFAILMIKPDGLENTYVFSNDKFIKIDEKFIKLELLKNIGYKYKLESKNFKMDREAFAYYKPTKTEKENYLDYHTGKNHMGKKHVVFLISKIPDLSVVYNIYAFKKDFRKKYSEQERLRSANGYKKSIKTLIHSPEDYFELISNLALFYPERFAEFININEIKLIRDLKDECCKRKINEELKGKFFNQQQIQDICNKNKKQYDTFFKKIEQTIKQIKQKEKTITENKQDMYKEIRHTIPKSEIITKEAFRKHQIKEKERKILQKYREFVKKQRKHTNSVCNTSII